MRSAISAVSSKYTVHSMQAFYMHEIPGFLPESANYSLSTLKSESVFASLIIKRLLGIR